MREPTLDAEYWMLDVTIQAWRLSALE